VDPGNAEARAPLYDPATAGWDPAMCDRFGVPLSVLPEIREATDVVGGVTTEAARRTGLAVGTPVICGSIDGLAEYLSSGVIKSGEGCVIFGSTMCMSVLSSVPRSHPLLYSGRSLVPGLYRLSGGMATSGALTRWFRDNFASDEVQTERASGISAYQLLGDQAATVPPGADGLMVLPYFSGERTPIFDIQARGLVLGLTTSHTRHHLYRGLLEGVAYGVRHHFDLMAEVGVMPRRLVAVGGGSQSELWTQILSDVTGQTLECVERPIGPALANAFLAGYGVGLFSDFAPLAERWVRIGRTVQPNPRVSAVYDQYYRVYRRLYERTAEEMHELARLSASLAALAARQTDRSADARPRAPQ
jgi:xylulokinase